MERSRPYNLANASNFFLLVKVRVQLLVKKEQLNLNFKKKGIIGTDVLLAALRPNHLDRCSRLAGRMQLRPPPLRLGPPAGRSRPDVGPGLVEDWTSGPAPQNPSNSYFPTSRIGPCPTLRFRLFRKPCDVCDACRTPPDARHGHFDLDGETSVSAYSRGRHC